MTKKEQRILGWIDDLIHTADALYKERVDLHDQEKKSISSAMKRLYKCESLSWLITRKTVKQWEDDRNVITSIIDELKNKHNQDL